MPDLFCFDLIIFKMISVRRVSYMDKKIVIGCKMTKKGILVNVLLLSFYGFFGVFGYLGNISPHLNLSPNMDKLVCVLIFIIILFFLTSLSGANEIMEFSRQQICYYYAQGFINQWQEVIRILCNKPAKPTISIHTADISKLNLSYTSHMYGWGLKGYRLKITVLLKDGTVFSFFPVSINQMEKGDYEAVLKLLEDNGIAIVDRYSLRNVLNKNSRIFYQYIKAIEERKNKC